MRIIAGRCRGMRLVAPEGRTVRPSSDFLRGAVMSALGGSFSGEQMLDTCAGTGAMALEFLSRGCSAAVAIEVDPAALTALRANATHTKLQAQLEVRQGDVLQQLQALAVAGRRFDYVYVDPPYDSELYAPILQCLHDLELLQPEAQVLVESRRGLSPEQLLGWQVLAQRRYGSSCLQRLTKETP